MKTLKNMIIGILIGVAVIVIGAIISAQEKKMDETYTATATATVTDWVQEESTDEDGNTSYDYYPILSYTYEGKEYGGKYSQSFSKIEYAEGSEIEVRFDPTNPSECNIIGDNRTEILPKIMIPAGIAIIVLSILGVFFKRH